jgi:inosose dehydratase
MTEIKLSCASSAWGKNGFVEAVSAIAKAGFDGIECSARLVTEFEDRLHVFEEILDIANLQLCAMSQYADFLDAETADETVERIANTSRFLGAIGNAVLLVTPANREDEDMSAEEWITAAAVLEEMSIRCSEFNVPLVFRSRAGLLGGSEKGLKRLLSMVAPDNMHLCCDTAELSLAGVTAERFFKAYEDRVIYVRARDVSGAKRRQAITSIQPGTAPQFGRGAIDFPKFGKTLSKQNYLGWLTIDVAGESASPRSAAEAAYRFMLRKSELFL